MATACASMPFMDESTFVAIGHCVLPGIPPAAVGVVSADPWAWAKSPPGPPSPGLSVTSTVIGVAPGAKHGYPTARGSAQGPFASFGAAAGGDAAEASANLP